MADKRGTTWWLMDQEGKVAGECWGQPLATGHSEPLVHASDVARWSKAQYTLFCITPRDGRRKMTREIVEAELEATTGKHYINLYHLGGVRLPRETTR